MNFTFNLLETQSEVDATLTQSTDGPLINFIAVPSPVMVGAFRFESAYYPGTFLAYRQPNKLLVVRQRGEENVNCSIDFSMVKFETNKM